MQNLDTHIAKITKEKKNAEESNRQLSENLQAEEDKVNHLQKLKQKLEANLDEVSKNMLKGVLIRSDIFHSY